MAVRVPPAMSPSFSVSTVEVAAMPDSAFCKGFRSSYDSSPSPTFPEDEEVEESLDSDSEGEDVEDEGPTAEDEDLATRDEGFASRDEATVWELRVLPLGLGYGALRRREIALRKGRMPSVFEVGQSFGFIPESERPERVSALRQPTLTTWIDPKDGIAYIDVHAYLPPAPPVQTSPSPKWSSGSLPISPTPSIATLQRELQEMSCYCFGAGKGP
nr:hypothetical protein [Tanacetum cinerariifolium]